MQQSALRVAELLPEGRESYLGPAEVVRVEGSVVHAALPEGAVIRAELALAYPYEPSKGDVLLVIGKGDDHYVIGVLRGSGRAVLAFQGDVELRAVGGALRLSGDEGVDLHGRSVEVHTGALRMVADRAVQTFSTLCQRVSALLSVQSGESHTVVEGASHTQAKSASILTAETMTINGKQIHLG
jgi:hypothetical protein